MSEKNTGSNATSDIIDSTLKNMKSLIDSSAVIGEPINTPTGGLILPVCKVSFGYGIGGGDLPSAAKNMYGGGSGGGVNITPIAFLVIENGNIRLLPIQQFNGSIDRIINTAPDLMDKLGMFVDSIRNKNAKKAEEQQEEDSEC